jgi:hypothetical protein
MNRNKEESEGIGAIKYTISTPPQERNGNYGGLNDQWEQGEQHNGITEGCNMKRWKRKGTTWRTHRTVTLACIHMCFFHAQLMLQP